MKAYLDMCCLKRPFDDQTQLRIRLESEAVLSLLSAESEAVQFIRSHPLILENSFNPVRERAARVNEWLDAGLPEMVDHVKLKGRVEDLMKMGFKSFDAMHVACAEEAGAHALATCDDRFLGAAKRNEGQLKVRVVSVVDLAKEVMK